MGASAVEATLKAALESANFWSEVSAFIVVVGVVMELVEVLFFDKTIPLKERRVLIAGSILVVIGVGGELVFANRVSTLAAQIQQFSDENVAQAQKDAANARKDAADALSKAASLGVSFGNLNKFVSDAEKKNTDVIADLNRNRDALEASRKEAVASVSAAKKALSDMQAVKEKIDEFTTPRLLSNDQILKVGAAIKPFSKTPFVLSLYDDVEPRDFANTLIGALTIGDWEWKPWESGGALILRYGKNPLVGTLSVRGVVIQFVNSDKGTLEKPAIALVDALKSNGIKVNEFSSLTHQQAEELGRKAGAIHIMIGRRQ